MATPRTAKRSIHMGWGRLHFAPHYPDMAVLAAEMLREGEGERDVAFPVVDPHVLLAEAPQELFLDPSHTYRRQIEPADAQPPERPGYSILELRDEDDVDEVNRVLGRNQMVPFDVAAAMRRRDDDMVTHLIAVTGRDGREVIGTVTVVDQWAAFGDQERGIGLWCLAVDPDAGLPGVGRALVEEVLAIAARRGAPTLDLSVMHDNEPAVRLYEAMGFERVPVFTIKRRNPINEPLFVPPSEQPPMNPYAEIIVREARRRGIGVEILDHEAAIFRLSHGGRMVDCRESLCSLVDAVAMTRVSDKRLTHRVLERAGVRMPAWTDSRDPDERLAFLGEQDRIVVKPADGEQGRGITIGVSAPDELDAALARAGDGDEPVILEELVDGIDLRIIVIDGEVVAAATREPATVTGDGKHDVRTLIAKQSRRREAATGGESRIPIDDETEAVVAAAGLSLDDVLPQGRSLRVRRTANLHTGGTIHDVTPALHPALADTALHVAAELRLPVVGLDLLVPRVDGPDYVLIEANERPGLANHEPQPTAERFIDFLFPATAAPRLH